MFVNCSECDKSLAINDVKYHTPPKDNKIEHAFCDAYCSNSWYSKNKEQSNDDD
jgi:hypothetical protein